MQKNWQHHWHPCTQISDFETFPPLTVTHAQGSWLHTKEAGPLLDATSSWWCKHLGHRHPALVEAMQQQSQSVIHSLGANTTSTSTIELSRRLAQWLPGLNKVFYAGDGSCAVEIALKMALHAKQLLGQTQRRHVIKLAGAYHGETIMTMAVSDCASYKAPYAAWMCDTHTIENMPYVHHTTDDLWGDYQVGWPAIEAQLAPHADKACAIIVEPLLQGANHMRFYSKDFLARLARWAKAHDVYLIADEIMTGFWRTGALLACQHANVVPDFVCLGKGLTSGMLPISAVLASESVFDVFYGPKDTHPGFLHSHTFSGHALSAAVANAALTLYETLPMQQMVEKLGQQMLTQVQSIQQGLGCFENIRQLGGVVAAELTAPFRRGGRAGWRIQQAAVKHGVLLRPLGDTIYWCPPLNTCLDDIDHLAKATSAAIKAVYQKEDTTLA